MDILPQSGSYEQLPLFPETPKKVCKGCATEYPATVEFWYSRGQTLFGKCKSCVNKQNDIWRKANREKVRVHEQRYRDSHREQVREADRRYYHNNIEKERERDKQWRHQHRHIVSLRNRRYRLLNPDKNRQRITQWRYDNPDKARAISHRSYRANPKQKLVHNHRRRARLAAAEGTFTEAEVQQLYAEQGGKCFHCACELNDVFDRDHWIPLSRGGSNWISNIRLLCDFCNSSKHNKLPHEWCPEKYSPPE